MLAMQTAISQENPPLRPPAGALRRVPLQELPLSSSGTLLGCRRRIVRPTPSVDKENLHAVVDALQHRQLTLSHRAYEIFRLASQLQRRRDQLQDSLQRTTQDPDTANQSPTARVTTHPRLSMPLIDSDDSGSEPDLSVLGMVRAGTLEQQQMEAMAYDDEALSQEQYEAEDTSVEEQTDEQEAMPLTDPATMGLKEISNLGKFTVSSQKPGNGIEELRSDDLKLYWQSDGPQPHKLTVYFVKRVGIRDIRFFVDYNEDESYTPTKIVFKSGTSENNLIEFATMNLENPVGWQQVPIAGAGGDPDGNTLVSYVLQMQIIENHQNGKDTHLRGIKIYAFDTDSAQGAGFENNPVDDVEGLVDDALGHDVSDDLNERFSRVGVGRQPGAVRFEPGDGGLSIPDFMRDPEIR